MQALVVGNVVQFAREADSLRNGPGAGAGAEVKPRGGGAHLRGADNGPAGVCAGPRSATSRTFMTVTESWHELARGWW